MFITLSLLVAMVAGRMSYEGQQVLQCEITDHAFDVYNATEMLDVWGCSNDRCDIRVKTDAEKKHLLDFFQGRCQVMISNLETPMAQFDAVHRQARFRYLQKQKNASDLTFPPADWFTAYHELQETDKFWAELAANYEDYRGLTVARQAIGTTYEGNALYAIRVVARATNPWVYLQCQIHAREWISGATCQWIVNELLSTYDPTDADNILNLVNLAITTVANPDGFQYTHTGDRLWRKNRAPCNQPFGRGVDLNRNYDDHWGQGGSSTSCSSDTYMGPSPASEPETQATSAFFESLFRDGQPVYGAIDFHSYSQLVLRPYGWTRDDSRDEAAQKALGDSYSAAVREIHGRSYTSQKSVDLYITTGSAGDWFYGAGSNNNPGYRAAGFTIELRPATAFPFGFQLPPEEIIPTAEENLAGVEEFVRRLVASPLAK